MNGVAFAAYVEQVLAPTLKPGDALGHGRPPGHKLAMQDAIRAAGAELRVLPPDGPDFTPMRWPSRS